MRELKAKFDQELSKLFEKYGVFFAFGKEQFAQKADPKIEYISVIGMGDCCPKENAKAFSKELSELHKKQRETELAVCGKENIILYELANHECFYTGDYSEIFEHMKTYGITPEEVKEVYLKHIKRYDD